MVNPCCELHLGRLERVVCGELNRQEENTLGVRRVALETISQPEILRAKGTEKRLTGPMIVACHWNCMNLHVSNEISKRDAS